ncbi:MAG TPA: Pycsar system effector family protein [Cyclobacteriaceae bacterium]
MESELARKTREFAENVFKDKAFEKRYFHNIDHTRDVVKAVKEIGQQSALTDDEIESATLAAWLHDVGYREGSENHEQTSAAEAKTLLEGWGASHKKIKEVTEAILATKVPQRPQSLIEKVLCDADLHHLSTEESITKSNKLRAEWEIFGSRPVNDKEWMEGTLAFMENHTYHTPYGQSILQHGKKKNIKKLRKMIKPEISEKKFNKMEEELVKLRAKLDKEKALRPDRGVETLFRTTSHNHLMLSQMADNKANILITINSIILSVLVTLLARKIDDIPLLIIPSVMIVTVCLTTMVFAILSTRPNITAGKFSRDDVKSKKTNLLFFGNFHGMDIEDYEWSMKEMMKDADYLYGSLIKDIYYLGKVLGKKYKFLRLAYNIFMFGFVVSVIAFTVVFSMSS